MFIINSIKNYIYIFILNSVQFIYNGWHANIKEDIKDIIFMLNMKNLIFYENHDNKSLYI